MPAKKRVRPLSVIIAAAGESFRMREGSRGAVRKPFVRLGDKTVLERVVELFGSLPYVREIVVAVHASDLTKAKRLLCARVGLVDLRLAKPACWIVGGGRRRQDSVRRALGALSPEARWVLVHDGARPFVSAALVGAVFAAARKAGAAAPGLPIQDTLRQIGKASLLVGSRRAERTVPRSGLWTIQTPQVIRRDFLEKGFTRLERSGKTVTDDLALVEPLGIRPAIIPGDPLNFKLTTQADLALARRLLARGVLPHTSGRGC